MNIEITERIKNPFMIILIIDIIFGILFTALCISTGESTVLVVSLILLIQTQVFSYLTSKLEYSTDKDGVYIRILSWMLCVLGHAMYVMLTAHAILSL